MHEHVPLGMHHVHTQDCAVWAQVCSVVCAYLCLTACMCLYTCSYVCVLFRFLRGCIQVCLCGECMHSYMCCGDLSVCSCPSMLCVRVHAHLCVLWGSVGTMFVHFRVCHEVPCIYSCLCVQ